MKKPTPEQLRQAEEELLKPIAEKQKQEQARPINLSLEDSILLVNSFDNALDQLLRQGYKIISPQENAYLRIKAGKDHEISTSGNYTSAGFVYAKNSYPIIVQDSPLLDLDLARQAVKANKESRYFSTSDLSIYEKYLKQAEKDSSLEPEKRSAVILPSRVSGQVSLQDNSKLLQVIFKNQAKDYISFLGQERIPVGLLEQGVVDSSLGTILTQLWLRGLGNVYRSGLYGDGRALDCSSSVRGVRLASPIGLASAKNGGKI